MTAKHFIKLADNVAHAEALVREGVLRTPESVVKHLAFTLGATCEHFNENFSWYKWNTAIFGEEPRNEQQDTGDGEVSG